MRVMAFPAGEVLHIVDAFLEFHFDILKVILGKALVVSMTIQAHEVLLKPYLKGVRESHKVVGVTIGTAESLVNRRVKGIPVNGPVGTHMISNASARVGIFNKVLLFSVALQTGFVVFHEVIHFEVRGFNFQAIV